MDDKSGYLYLPLHQIRWLFPLSQNHSNYDIFKMSPVVSFCLAGKLNPLKSHLSGFGRSPIIAILLQMCVYTGINSQNLDIEPH